MTKKIFKLRFILLLSTLLSCGASISPIAPTRISSNNIELNKEYIKEIGSSLVVKGDLQQRDAIRITKMTPFNINLTSFPYSTGDILPLLGQNGTWLFYYDKSKQTQYQIGIAKHKQTGEYKAFVNSANGFLSRSMKNIELVEEFVIPEDCNNCFKQEFVFNGRVGNNLKFLYREYSSDFIRADFNQELQYDVSESNIVGFKGLRLSIMKTTNTNITYKVISTFD